MTTPTPTGALPPEDTASVDVTVTYVLPEVGLARVITPAGLRLVVTRRTPGLGAVELVAGQPLVCVVTREPHRVLSARVLPISVVAGHQPGESFDEIALRTGWRTLSDAYLQDSEAGGLSRYGRDDALFESGYVAVMQVVGPRVTAGREHPSAALVQSAAREAGVSWQAGGPAHQFLAQRYDPDYRERLNAALLHAWALQMRYAAGWS